MDSYFHLRCSHRQLVSRMCRFCQLNDGVGKRELRLFLTFIQLRCDQPDREEAGGAPSDVRVEPECRMSFQLKCRDVHVNDRNNSVDAQRQQLLQVSPGAPDAVQRNDVSQQFALPRRTQLGTQAQGGPPCEPGKKFLRRLHGVKNPVQPGNLFSQSLVVAMRYYVSNDDSPGIGSLLL